MNIGIVGGSIAGCSAAYLLMREGYHVDIFERTGGSLVGRGGGIGTTSDTMNKLINDGLIHESFPRFSIESMPLIGKSAVDEPHGRIAWEMPTGFDVFHWNELWRALRTHVPDSCFHGGVRIIDAMQVGDEVILKTESGSRYAYDLVVFADGYNSLGRKIIFPNVKLQYRGYVLWRGLLEEKMMPQSVLQNQILRLSHTEAPGHTVVYFIPSIDGRISHGSRMFNWAAYVPVAESEMNVFMTDKDGKVRDGTMPPGYMSNTTRFGLIDFIQNRIPEFYAQVIGKTSGSYVQVIYTVDLPAYRQGRMCLIGDAGVVVQPFTGSGVFKGYNNASDLIASLREESSIESALANWSQQQLARGRRLLRLGGQMERAFIWDQPDFAMISKDEVIQWWRSSVTFPDEFDYSRES